jgi:uncharacterized protein (DUF927 family)
VEETMSQINDNNQTFIDFDKIERMTSTEFISAIKNVTNKHKDKITVKVETYNEEQEDLVSVYVYIVTYAKFYVFRHMRTSFGKGFWSLDSISLRDFNIFSDLQEKLLQR